MLLVYFCITSKIDNRLLNSIIIIITHFIRKFTPEISAQLTSLKCCVLAQIKPSMPLNPSPIPFIKCLRNLTLKTLIDLYICQNKRETFNLWLSRRSVHQISASSQWASPFGEREKERGKNEAAAGFNSSYYWNMSATCRRTNHRHLTARRKGCHFSSRYAKREKVVFGGLGFRIASFPVAQGLAAIGREFRPSPLWRTKVSSEVADLETQWGLGKWVSASCTIRWRICRGFGSRHWRWLGGNMESKEKP